MRFTRRLLLLLLLVGTVTTTVGAASPPAAPVTSSARFMRVSCARFGKTLHTTVCGYLIVPENRAKPHGRMVRLAVAIFKSPIQPAAPDPVVFLNGGPGAPTIRALGGLSEASLPVLVGDRDLILVDQRGTGLSQPSLACPEVNAATLHALNPQLNPQRAATLALQAVHACHDRLVRSGVDLHAYTTLTDAADIAALGPALGYSRVNLMGGSYGTRLALTVMRLYPGAIRSVILDSVFPPQANLYTQMPRNMAYALSVLVAGCAADQRCHTAYPDLERDLFTVVNRLGAAPVPVHVTLPTTGKQYQALLTGSVFANVIYNMMYSTPAIPMLPRVIADATHGRFEVVVQVYGQLLAESALEARGLYLSDECSEDAPFTSPAQIAVAVQTLPPQWQASVLVEQVSELHMCQIWHVNPVPAWQKTAVRSAIPTLILTGHYDPATPPALGKLAAQTLSHSFFYTFPAGGHGQYFDASLCPATIGVEFLRTPTTKPDATCMKGLTPPAFL
jgi:pimeloyl-ACP methyl ester carboxylesterase